MNAVNNIMALRFREKKKNRLDENSYVRVGYEFIQETQCTCTRERVVTSSSKSRLPLYYRLLVDVIFPLVYYAYNLP